MSVANYIDSLNRAYSSDDTPDVIRRVKQAIISQIHELDPRVKARTTDFFTHSFAPDIILSWDRQGSERPLFIRQVVDDQQIEDDLPLMRSERPIIFGLEPSSPRPERISNSSDNVRESSTLLTDASGVDTIAGRRAGSRVVDIASPALLQGGRGLLDESTAEQIATGLTRGFFAAGNLRTQDTRTTVRLIQLVFRPVTADRLTEFLRAVWIGAGGSSSEFPGPSNLQAGLTDEALEFLLEFEQNDNLDVWRRIGSAVDLAQITRLRVPQSPNLDSLITANIDRISGKACNVYRHEWVLEERESTNGKWSVNQNVPALEWSGEERGITFANSREALTGWAPASYPMTPSVFLEKAEEAGLAFESVEILSGALKIDYGVADSSPGQNVINDPQLRANAGNLSSGGEVRTAVARVPGLAPLVLNFHHGEASGRTAARFSIREFLLYAIPMLAGTLNEVDSASLRAILETNRLLIEPPTLFDFD